MPSDFLFLILFLSPQCPTQDPQLPFQNPSFFGLLDTFVLGFLYFCFSPCPSMHVGVSEVPSLVLFLLYVSGEDVTFIPGPSITGKFPVCLGSSCLSSPGMLLIQVSHRHPTQPTPKGAHRCPSTTDFWSAARLGLLSLLLGCPSCDFRAPP